MSNNTVTNPPEIIYPLNGFDIGFLVMCGLTLITNVVGLIILISGRQRLKGPSYNILISSYVSCILVAIWYEIFDVLVQKQVPNVYIRGLICNFGGSGSMALMANINLHLCLISAERYVFVMYPFNYHKIVNRLNVIIALVAVWLLPIFVMMGSFFYREISLTQCTFRIVQPRQIVINDAICLTITLGLLYFIPLFTIVTVYVRIFVLIQSHGSRGQQTESKDRARLAKNSKAIRQMVILIGVFFICWTPFAICSLCFLWISAYINQSLFLAQYNMAWAVFVLRYLAYCYPLFHPVLYCYFNAHIKLEALRIYYKLIGKEEAYRRLLHTMHGTTSFYMERKSTTTM
ncbi:Trace amine-associated receptor 4 [Trichoplax sp. H2]|nr:Trace amine-associated receptor 4 [Trichoplax sp. H2]|eukprot:RDD41847.1 Trace amine-associated receptor 4 [Trichoplax sp. H2]